MARPRLRSDHSGLFAVQTVPFSLSISPDWAVEHGRILYDANVDIVGGFPGFADRSAALESVHLQITDRYLLVDEGQLHGFGVPIAAITGIVLVPQPRREDTALRVFYNDSGAPRLFTMRFRSSRIGTRGVARSVRAKQALLDAGIMDEFAMEPPPDPNFTLPWDQTRAFESENVIWTGRATAPIFVGSDSAPSDVWLTTKSLIWGSGEGEGLNRIPLTLLMDLVSTRLRDRAGTPVIYLSIGDRHTGRFEIPFVFDLQTPPDRNFRERGAMLVGLRSRGLPDGSPALARQPWRAESTTYDPPRLHLVEEVDDADHVPAAVEPLPLLTFDAPLRRRGGLGGRSHRDLAGDSAPNEPDRDPAASNETQAPPADILVEEALAAVPMEEDSTERFTRVQPSATNADDQLLAEFSPLPASSEPAGDVQVETSWSAPAEPTIDSKSWVVMSMPPGIRLPIADVIRPSAAIEESWSAVRGYEEAAIGALADALRVIDERVAGTFELVLNEHAPSSWAHARALAALVELQDRGAATNEEIRLRRERLLSLGDVCVRMRTLVELFDGGYLSQTELDAKRGKLIRQLSSSLIPD